MSEKTKWQRDEASRTIAASLCQPACRMVAVQVWVNEGVAGHEFIPIVALQSVVKREYLSPPYTNSAPSDEGLDRDLAREGWRLTQQTARVDAMLVWDDDVIRFSELVDLSWTNANFQLVATPWPPEEDATRLASVVEELAAIVRRRLERQAAEQAKEPSP